MVIRDWDVQGTSSKSLELIGSDTASLALDREPEILLFDTPPSLEHTATSTAVRNADIALVVTTPSPADIWEAEEAVQFVQAHNSDAVVRVVFNKVRRSTILGRLAEETPVTANIPTLPARLSSRECYQHAIAQGWKALNGSAREEVLQLGLAVLSLRT